MVFLYLEIEGKPSLGLAAPFSVCVIQNIASDCTYKPSQFLILVYVLEHNRIYNHIALRTLRLALGGKQVLQSTVLYGVREVSPKKHNLCNLK